MVTSNVSDKVEIKITSAMIDAGVDELKCRYLDLHYGVLFPEIVETLFVRMCKAGATSYQPSCDIR